MMLDGPGPAYAPERPLAVKRPEAGTDVAELVAAVRRLVDRDTAAEMDRLRTIMLDLLAGHLPLEGAVYRAVHG